MRRLVRAGLVAALLVGTVALSITMGEAPARMRRLRAQWHSRFRSPTTLARAFLAPTTDLARSFCEGPCLAFFTQPGVDVTIDTPDGPLPSRRDGPNVRFEPVPTRTMPVVISWTPRAIDTGIGLASPDRCGQLGPALSTRPDTISGGRASLRLVLAPGPEPRLERP
ncbi:MAG: hypothetical protein JNJ54_13885 [Myxococcaceae bacterium]|nr:hypothetical protein [Myxococcaceae bacterium]